MKRRALLFGNSDGLSGVKVDLENYLRFLTSDIGGKWFDTEILIEMNPTRSGLLNKISYLKTEAPDYAFVVFSGHGAYIKGTVLEINKYGEYIHESELRNISSRQISIFDCCRNVSSVSLSDSKFFGKLASLNESQKYLREIYNTRIMQAIAQQVSLYACSVGESSYETNEGGIYSNCLLSSVNPSRNEQFKLVGVAQEESKPKTRKKAWEVYSKIQTPDHSIPRCLNSQQLIISINPNPVIF